MYNETTEIMPGFYDKYVAMAPIMLVGDFNAHVRLGYHLGSRQNTSLGFMYDLLFGDVLILCDFQFQQSVKYTYSWDEAGVYAWIDHFVSMKFNFENTVMCEIVPKTNSMSVIAYQSPSMWAQRIVEI